MDNAKSHHNHLYRCYFCRNFQLEGHRWGYCKLLNVYVEGNKDACQLSLPPFTSTEERLDIDPQDK